MFTKKVTPIPLLSTFRFTAEDARYAEFSRTGLQDKIVATYGKVAKVRSFTL